MFSLFSNFFLFLATMLRWWMKSSLKTLNGKTAPTAEYQKAYKNFSPETIVITISKSTALCAFVFEIFSCFVFPHEKPLFYCCFLHPLLYFTLIAIAMRRISFLRYISSAEGRQRCETLRMRISLMYFACSLPRLTLKIEPKASFQRIKAKAMIRKRQHLGPEAKVEQVFSKIAWKKLIN